MGTSRSTFPLRRSVLKQGTPVLFGTDLGQFGEDVADEYFDFYPQRQAQFVVAHPHGAALELFVRLERLVFADPIDVQRTPDDVALLSLPAEFFASEHLDPDQIHPFAGKDGEAEGVAILQRLAAGQQQRTRHVAQPRDIKIKPIAG